MLILQLSPSRNLSAATGASCRQQASCQRAIVNFSSAQQLRQFCQIDRLIDPVFLLADYIVTPIKAKQGVLR